MKRTILALAVCSLFAVSTQAQNAPKASSQVATANQAEIKFEAEEFNFGTIKQGDVVNHEFKFTNVGKEPLVITDAHGSCGCTVPEYPKEPIKKGQTGIIKVTFNSAGKMGLQDKTVTINSNGKTPQKVIHIKGTIVEKAKEEPKN